MKEERLDKFLANAGVGSRKEVKDYLKQRRIRVSGEVVTRPESKVDPDQDEILLDGKSIRKAGKAYYWFHKPAGCITASRDDREQTVMDYFADAGEKDLFPVGRLDKDTEGLLLVTNDGELSHYLLSPRRHVEKTYYAQVDGCIGEKEIALFREGVDIGDDKKTLPAVLNVVRSGENGSEILLTIQEGRYHQVKRMFEAVNSHVNYLKRVSFGSIPLEKTLEKGTYRTLTDEELSILKEQANCRKKGTKEP